MSIFPTKILVATDGSPEAALAAHTAAQIADETGSELHYRLCAPQERAPSSRPLRRPGGGGALAAKRTGAS
jgi:nucleotide-binding universal stress UspA family protein